MKSYTITVNGNVYDVTVEEKAAGAAPAAPVQKKAPVAPKAAPAPKKAAGTGNVKVTAGAAGSCRTAGRKRSTDRCDRGDENGNPGCSSGGGNRSQH